MARKHTSFSSTFSHWQILAVSVLRCNELTQFFSDGSNDGLQNWNQIFNFYLLIAVLRQQIEFFVKCVCLILNQMESIEREHKWTPVSNSKYIGSDILFQGRAGYAEKILFWWFGIIFSPCPEFQDWVRISHLCLMTLWWLLKQRIDKESSFAIPLIVFFCRYSTNECEIPHP